MSRNWLKIQGVNGPPAHGGEWFKVLWTELSGRETKLRVSMAVPLDATSQQFFLFSANGRVFEKVTLFLQPLTDLYFYECEFRWVTTEDSLAGDVSVSFELWYERHGFKYSS